MDKALIDYDKNLEELERQREKLEKALQMMGQEWEESGAGIGWLGSLDLPVINQDITDPIIPSEIVTTVETIATTTASNDSTTAAVSPVTTSTTATTLIKPITLPLFTNILLPNTGPSPEYLQSLLHVNKTLLAQSLAKTLSTSNPTPMLTPVEEQLNEMLVDDTSNELNSPLITPSSHNDDNTQEQQYMGDNNNDPDSEMIISPLTTTTDKNLPTTNINTNTIQTKK